MIPIRNLLVMLAYAFDTLELIDELEAESEAWDGPNDLIAVVLSREIQRIARKGLSRGYVARLETGSSPRGRIEFAPSLPLLVRRAPQLVYSTDELQVDTVENRVIRAACRRLLASDGLSAAVHEQLSDAIHLLRDVSEEPLSLRGCRRVRVNATNRHYRLAIEVCALLAQEALADPAGGDARFLRPRRDEVRLRALFERFVRRFFHREQKAFRVRAPHLSWLVSATASSSLALPRMRTDVVLDQGDRGIVLDTKFTSASSSSYRGSLTARSSHLYQMWAYLTHLKPHYRELTGIVLYPKVCAQQDTLWSGAGFNLRVCYVDLGAPWGELKRSLLALLKAPQGTQLGQQRIEASLD